MSRTSDRGYMRNRRRIRNDDICHHCGGWINPELNWPDPGAWAADHLNPVGKGGHNRGPLAPCHWKCNLARRYQKPPPTKHSRQW